MVRLLKKAAIVAMFVGLGVGSAWGADFDFGDSTTNTTGLGTGADFVYLENSASQQVPPALNFSITGGQTVTVGTASSNMHTTQGGTIQFGEVIFNNASKLELTQADSPNNGRGMQLTIAEVKYDNSAGGSVITVKASGTGDNQNRMTINKITYSAGLYGSNKTNAIEVEGNSYLLVNETGGTVLGHYDGTHYLATDLTLGDATNTLGTIEFKDGLTLRAGKITGNGRIIGGVTLDDTISGTAGEAAIEVASGKTQVYEGDVSVIKGSVAVGQAANNGAASMQVVGDLNLSTADSVLNVSSTNDKDSELAVTGTLRLDGVAATNAVVAGNATKGIYAKVTAGNLVMDSASQLDVRSNGVLDIGDGSSNVAQISSGVINLTGGGTAVFNNGVELGVTGVPASSGIINVDGVNTTVVFRDSVDFNNSTSGINLSNNGTADFRNLGEGLTLNQGFVRSTAGSTKSVVGSAGFNLDEDGKLIVDAGSTHSIMYNEKQDQNKGATGNLNVNTGAAMEINGTLAAYDFVVTEKFGTDNLFVAGSNGTLKVNDYTVEAGADVKKNATVTILAEGTGVFYGKQGFADTRNTFEGGVIVNGSEGEIYTDGANAAIAINKTSTPDMLNSIVVRDGGKLTAANGRILTLTNNNSESQASLAVRGLGGNRFTGEIRASKTAASSGFTLDVNSDLELDHADVYVNSYKQDSGYVRDVDQGDSVIHATNDAIASSIHGSDSIFDASGVFSGGLNVYDKATVVGSDRNYLDSGAVKKGIASFNNARIDLTNGNLDIRNFKEVHLTGDSELLIGYNRGVNKLELHNTQLNTHNLKNQVKLNDDYLTHYYNDVRSITAGNPSTSVDRIISGNVVGTGNWTVSNVFGDFGFKFDNKQGAWLDSYDRTNLYDMNEVMGQLGKNWESATISHGLATNVAAAAKNMLGQVDGMTVLPGSTAGQLNLDIMKSLASANHTFNSGGVSGIMDRGLLAAYNGSVASGPIYVAQDTTRDLINTLHSRLDAYRKVQECATPEGFGTASALGSASVMNERYLNRVWAGALGTWQNADKRKGFDGYKYNGAGVIMGYDRAVGAAIMGASVAYVEGDYKDKSAISHDSKIKQYAADVYATYNASSGFFATVMGGFNYGDNDIKEIRGNNNTRADYNTYTWHAGAKVGYDIEPCDNFTITPSVGANFFYTRATSHNFRLADQSVLHYGSMKNNNIEIPVDVKVAYEIPMGEDKGLTLMANGGYAYNLNDKGVNGSLSLNGNGNVESYRAIGRKLGHHSWNAGLGVKYRMNQWDIGVKYDYQGRNNYHNQRIMGTVGYSF